MQTNRPKKSDIRSTAKLLLKEGKSKQEVFDELLEKYHYAKDVAEVLKYIPTNSSIAKYNGWNIVLLINLIIIIGLILLSSGSYVSVIYYVLITIVVFKKSLKHYVWVSVLSAVGLIGVAGAAMNGDNWSWPWIIIVVVILAPPLFISYWLPGKLSPPPIESKEQFTNAEGETRLRVVYSFKDVG